MPRISAPTVAEHHARQRAAIVAEAVELLVGQGPHAVTPAAAGRAAGLRRSSVYQYFPSSAALLTAVVDTCFEQAVHGVADEVSAHDDPLDQVEAYVRAVLRDGARWQAAAHALVGVDIPAEVHTRIGGWLQTATRPLLVALQAVPVERPQLVARLLLGMVEAAGRHGQGGPPAVVPPGPHGAVAPADLAQTARMARAAVLAARTADAPPAAGT